MTILAKPNYQFEKRQKELAKKSKKEEKRRQKAVVGAAAEEDSPKEFAAEKVLLYSAENIR